MSTLYLPTSEQFAINRQSIAANGLKAWWPFLASQRGVTVRDLVADANGSFVGSPTWATDSLRGAVLRFDGTAGRVDIPHQSSIVSSSSQTVTAWFRRNGAQATWSTILIKSVNSGLSAPYLSYYITFNNTSDTQITFYTGHTNNSFPGVNSGAAAIADGVWYFAAGVYSNENDYIRLYLGDTSDMSFTFTQAADANGATAIDVGDSLLFGAFRFGASYTRYFKGDIGPVNFYNRALQSSEVANLFFNPWDLYLPSSSQITNTVPAIAILRAMFKAMHKAKFKKMR